jgi:hypothetical protein
MVPQVLMPSGTEVESQPTADVLSAPAFGFVLMPTSSQAALTNPVRGLVVTVAGNLCVNLADGSSNNSQPISVSAGAVYPFAAIQLGSNNTAGVLGLN